MDAAVDPNADPAAVVGGDAVAEVDVVSMAVAVAVAVAEADDAVRALPLRAPPSASSADTDADRRTAGGVVGAVQCRGEANDSATRACVALMRRCCGDKTGDDWSVAAAL